MKFRRRNPIGGTRSRDHVRLDRLRRQRPRHWSNFPDENRYVAHSSISGLKFGTRRPADCSKNVSINLKFWEEKNLEEKNLEEKKCCKTKKFYKKKILQKFKKKKKLLKKLKKKNFLKFFFLKTNFEKNFFGRIQLKIS